MVLVALLLMPPLLVSVQSTFCELDTTVAGLGTSCVFQTELKYYIKLLYIFGVGL
jgi:hypothetical protein